MLDYKNLVLTLGALVAALLFGCLPRKGKQDIPNFNSSSNILLFGLKGTIDFIFRRTPFLEECRKLYGSAFKFSCGAYDMFITSSPIAFKTFYQTRALDHREAHFRALQALGSSGNRGLLTTPVHEHFLPSFGRKLSRSSIAQEVLSPLYTHLLDRFQQVSLHKELRLSEVIENTLYETLTIIFFGPSFPLDTYEDFKVLDRNIALLFTPFGSTAFATKRARNRLHAVMMAYVQKNEHTTNEKTKIVISALSSVASLPREDKAACLLSLFWSIHSNLLKSIWWMMAYLAQDSTARHSLAVEIARELDPLRRRLGRVYQ
ncbi:Cytochrome P450 [Mycena sanguinolenta]|uniref:Cytochrome P450 n=1 Tax=Mycena sanguinolenta TaxID=230812 RepID=A0A8H7DKJ7_9AGAR|nr:Cytochrome P450 [Mycena sanguinolenta]